MIIELPEGLAPWSEQLCALQPDVARMLGPLIRRLDELVGGRREATGTSGEIDGYAGLARRGRPEQIVASEWLLAQEMPEEFWRRAANGELLHLAPAYRDDVSRGQTVLLNDGGPDLQGAPRLVQLALAIVLHRRAASAGQVLKLASLSAPAGDWFEGDLLGMLELWLAARSQSLTGTDNLQNWLDTVDRPDQVWVVTSPKLAREHAAIQQRGSAAHAEIVTVEEVDWAENGPTALAVHLAGERLHLPLPDPPAAIRVLRGRGWRRLPERSAAMLSTGGLAAPQLIGWPAFMVCRAGDAHEVITFRVPVSGSAAGRPRRRQFGAAVLGLGVAGARFVATVVDHERLCVRVVGKPLADVDQITVPLTLLGFGSDDIEAIAAQPLGPVYFERGALLTQLAGRWWWLKAGEPPLERADLVALMPGSTVDTPWAVRQVQRWLSVGEGGRVIGEDALDVVAGAGAVAWRAADGWGVVEVWPSYWVAQAKPGAGYPERQLLQVQADTTPIGLVRVQGALGLVTVSTAGILVRLVTAAGTKTLTRWSGAKAVPSVHSRLPLIAVQRMDGSVEVGNLDTGEVRLRVPAS